MSAYLRLKSLMYTLSLLLLLLFCGACQKEPLSWQEIVTADSLDDYLPVLDPEGKCKAYLEEYAAIGGEIGVLSTRSRMFPGCDLDAKVNARPHPDYEIIKIVVEHGLVMLKPRRPTPITPDALTLLGLPVVEPTQITRNGDLIWNRAFGNTCDLSKAPKAVCTPIGVHFRMWKTPGQIDNILLDFAGRHTADLPVLQTEDWVLPRSFIERDNFPQDDVLTFHITHREVQFEGKVFERTQLLVQEPLPGLHERLKERIAEKNQKATVRKMPYLGWLAFHTTRLTTFGELGRVASELKGSQIAKTQFVVASQPISRGVDLDTKHAEYRAINFVMNFSELKEGPEGEVKPFNLEVRMTSKGFDLFEQGRKLPPIEGCPVGGLTICLSSPQAEPLKFVTLAVEAESKGDYAAASQQVKAAMEVYPWTKLYNTVVDIKAARADETEVLLTAEPEIPVALMVPVMDTLFALRQGKACGQALRPGTLWTAEFCKSETAYNTYMELFPDVSLGFFDR